MLLPPGRCRTTDITWAGNLTGTTIQWRCSLEVLSHSSSIAQITLHPKHFHHPSPSIAFTLNPPPTLHLRLVSGELSPNRHLDLESTADALVGRAREIDKTNPSLPCSAQLSPLSLRLPARRRGSITFSPQEKKRHFSSWWCAWAAQYTSRIVTDMERSRVDRLDRSKIRQGTLRHLPALSGSRSDNYH